MQFKIKDKAKLQQLKKITGCNNLGQIVNEALSVYKTLFTRVREGYRVMLVPEDDGKPAIEIKFE